MCYLNVLDLCMHKFEQNKFFSLFEFAGEIIFRLDANTNILAKPNIVVVLILMTMQLVFIIIADISVSITHFFVAVFLFS